MWNYFIYLCFKRNSKQKIRELIYLRIVINAGHTKIGKGIGAYKYLNESRETRRIAYHLLYLLAGTNHEVIPAVFDVSNNNLNEAVTVSNSKKADLFVSIHLNAGGGEGVECYTWRGEKTKAAVDICSNISALGYKPEPSLIPLFL